MLRTLIVSILQNRIVEIVSSGKIIGRMSLADPSQSVTSADNLAAYRPRYHEYHRSNLGVLFLNIEGIFPCLSSQVICGKLTFEEDGFFQGRAFIDAADGGNNFRIFSSTMEIKTYGLALQDCPEINSTCWRTHASITIFCLLPREQCG